MIQSNQEQKDTDFECYRTNHFEVVLTDYENGLRKVEELRIATTKVKFDKLSGKLDLCVYATKSALEYIDTLHEGMLYSVEYILYSPDGERNFVVLKRLMKLTDISFESYTDSSEVLVVKLYFCYA